MVSHLNALLRSAMPYRRLRVIVLGPHHTTNKSLVNAVCQEGNTRSDLLCHRRGNATHSSVEPISDAAANDSGLSIIVSTLTS